MCRTRLARFGLLRQSIFAALLVCLVSLSLSGQVTSGTMYGTVKDPSGAVIPNATVVIASAQIGVERKVTTDGNGTFTAPNLPPATYTITVEATGFQKYQKEGVVLSAADRLNAGEFPLAVGSIDNSVTVTADSAELQLQTNSGERSDLVSNKQLNDIALNGRNVLDFVKVIPGVVSQVNAATAGTGHLDEFNVNGTRANQHEFTIDGASNVDTGNNGNTHVTINPDAVAEMKVLTSNYQAEFGKAGGGQIVVTTRSGTSQFHGDARYFHRHEGLNANDWFANQDGTSIGKYRYNTVGYQVGGPVLLPFKNFNKNRDRLYFFFGQEFYRQLIPSGLTQIRVPTDLERHGDFSQTRDGDGNPLTIYNPNTGQPFPGNKIDLALLTPAQQAAFAEVSKILNLYSLPNVTGSNSYNYSEQLSYDEPRREDILRIDYQLNSANRFFGRWVNNAATTKSPMQTWNLNCMGQLQFPGGCVNKNPSWNLALNWTSTISPTLLNEFSVGPSVNRSTWEGVNGNMSRATNNINLPLLYTVTGDTNIPDFSFGGNVGINYPWSYLGANPWFQSNTTINVNDNLTKVIKAHTLKFGMFLQRARKDQIGWGNYNGQASFDNCATSSDPVGCSDNNTGNAYASALLGYFRSFDQTSARPTGYFRYTNLEFYGQDTWKVTPRLTLDYGVRLAWYQPQFDAKDQLAIFDPGSYDPTQAVRLYLPKPGGGAFDPANPTVSVDGSLTGTIVPNSGSLTNGVQFASEGYYKGGWRDRGVMPEPRLGFAYGLGSSNKTVLRGGFGMMHDRIQGNLIFNPVFNNPSMVVTPTVLNNTLANLPSLAAAGAVSPNGGVVGAQKNGQVPTIYNFSVGLQRDIGWSSTIDVAYVGSLSRHLVRARNINAVPYGTAFTKDAQNPANFEGGIVPDVEPNLPDAYAQAGFNFSGQYAYDTQYLVPFKGYTAIEYYSFDGTANYNSLQISLQRRFTKALTLGVAYTYSKTLTTANSDEDYIDPYVNRTNDYRLASWDRPHVLAINYVYDLPSVTKHFGGPKWLSAITDNFQLSGITNFMSGAPIDTGIWWPPAQYFTGSTSDWKRPGFYLPVAVGANHSVGTSKFDPAGFMAPGIGVPTPGGRSVLRGGGLQNWDMSLFKNIKLGSNEQRYIQLRLEAFNVFNHPNFRDVNMNIGVNTPSGSDPATLSINPRPANTPISGDAKYGSYFGEYTNTYSGMGGPRVIQLGAKIYF